MAITAQLSTTAVRISEYLVLTNKQSSQLFDLSPSTWLRIRNGTFRGSLTKDQSLRVYILYSLIIILKEKNFNRNWLFATGVLKFSKLSPFELILEMGLIGITQLILDLNGAQLPIFSTSGPPQR
jgi:hypothetical protein